MFVNANGKLGTTVSSKRFKEHIKPMDKVSEVLYALSPVSFRYKKTIDPAGTSQLGLVAEDVEKVNPDLVVRDKEGKAYNVRYDQVNAMLLNEFLKHHQAFQEQQREGQQQDRKIQEQKTTIALLKKQMEAVVARLKEHDSEIQRVNAEVELSKSAPRAAVTER